MTQKNYLKPPQTKLVSSFRLKVKIIKKKIVSYIYEHIVTPYCQFKKNPFCRTILHKVSLEYRQIYPSNTADRTDVSRYGLLVEKLPLK